MTTFVLLGNAILNMKYEKFPLKLVFHLLMGICRICGWLLYLTPCTSNPNIFFNVSKKLISHTNTDFEFTKWELFTEEFVCTECSKSHFIKHMQNYHMNYDICILWLVIVLETWNSWIGLFILYISKVPNSKNNDSRSWKLHIGNNKKCQKIEVRCPTVGWQGQLWMRQRSLGQWGRQGQLRMRQRSTAIPMPNGR
jgi:hypothetical protein